MELSKIITEAREKEGLLMRELAAKIEVDIAQLANLKKEIETLQDLKY